MRLPHPETLRHPRPGPWLALLILLSAVLGCNGKIDIKLQISNTPFGSGLPPGTSALDIFASFDNKGATKPFQSVLLLDHPASKDDYYTVGIDLDLSNISSNPDTGAQIYVGAINGVSRCLIQYGVSPVLFPPYSVSELQVVLDKPAQGTALGDCHQGFPHFFSITQVVRVGSGSSTASIEVAGWGFMPDAEVTLNITPIPGSPATCQTVVSDPAVEVKWQDYTLLTLQLTDFKADALALMKLVNCRINVKVTNPSLPNSTITGYQDVIP